MPAWLIARRDLGANLHGYVGYVIMAAVLFATGLLFQLRGLGGGAQYSHDVLTAFFDNCGGVMVVATILLTMRSLAEERQLGTDVLLDTSPITVYDIVLGKYISVMTFVLLTLVLTLYMPALIFVNGKVSLGQIGVGYLGLFLLLSVTSSIGIAASSLFRSQLPAGVLAGVSVTILILGWLLADVTNPPFSAVFAYTALWDKHFMPLMEGRLSLATVVYFLSMTGVFLFAATRVLDGRRWK